MCLLIITANHSVNHILFFTRAYTDVVYDIPIYTSPCVKLCSVKLKRDYFYDNFIAYFYNFHNGLSVKNKLMFIDSETIYNIYKRLFLFIQFSVVF